MSNATVSKEKVNPISDEELLRRVTFESGAAFDACHAQVVERMNEILRDKPDEKKMNRVEHAIVRTGRSYGGDRNVAVAIACEEIAKIDKAKGGTDDPAYIAAQERKRLAARGSGT